MAVALPRLCGLRVTEGAVHVLTPASAEHSDCLSIRNLNLLTMQETATINNYRAKLTITK